MRKSVFVSSTYVDLAAHRREIWNLLEGYDVKVRGMETFGARKEAPLETCLAEVEQSDIYVGIIAHRLGSIDTETGLSFTQREYKRAYELKKDILVYLIDKDNASINIEDVDFGELHDKLEAFKATLTDRHTVDYFSTPKDLASKLGRAVKRRLNSLDALPDNLPDALVESSSLLKKFLLVPKALSGREVVLEIEVTGEPFAASRAVCSGFNFEYGETVGIPIKITKPEGFENVGLDYIFLRARQTDAFLPICDEEKRIVYCKLQFVDRPVENIRARLKNESYLSMATAQSLMGQSLMGKTVQLKADGRVILVLTDRIMKSGDG